MLFEQAPYLGLHACCYPAITKRFVVNELAHRGSPTGRKLVLFYFSEGLQAPGDDPPYQATLILLSLLVMPGFQAGEGLS